MSYEVATRAKIQWTNNIKKETKTTAAAAEGGVADWRKEKLIKRKESKAPRKKNSIKERAKKSKDQQICARISFQEPKYKPFDW